MSFVKRYSSVRQAETVFTGNTLCLSPLADVTGNIAGSGAVFTSLDTSLQVGGFPRSGEYRADHNGLFDAFLFSQRETLRFGAGRGCGIGRRPPFVRSG